MNRRNWLDLSRKLVDRFDFDYTVAAMAQAIGEEAIAKWGPGVINPLAYPDSLLVTPSGANMHVTVKAGQAYTDVGRKVTVPVDDDTPLLVSDPTNPTWSLLVLRYKATGDTLVPKPSNPILNVFLNLHDDYELIVRSGVPSVTPAYPATLADDIILMGFKIPAATTLASAATQDFSVVTYARFDAGEYDAITGTGPGSTDVSIAAALTRLNGNSKKILVGQSEALNATIAVPFNDIEFVPKPGVTISKGTAGTGFNVTGTGVRFDKMRLTGFTTAAIVFAVGANWGFVTRCRFSTCTDEVTDNTTGGNITQQANVTEV